MELLKTIQDESIAANLGADVRPEAAGAPAAALFSPALRTALAYLLALALAESLTTLTDARLGMVLHAAVLLAMLLQAALWSRGSQQRFLLTLALAPLIRVVSLTIPLPSFSLEYWYLVVGAPLFLAAFAAARLSRMNRGMLGLTGRKLPVQLLVGVSGLGLGLAEYLILRPGPLAPNLSWGQFWLLALILLVFTGLLEEFIFRGAMQYSALLNLGRFGLWYVPLVFAVLHLGYRSVADILFVFAVALFFGWIVQRTGSILGVTLSHGLTNIGLYLIFPFLLAGTAIPSAVPVTGPVIVETAAPIAAPPDILAPAKHVTPISPAVHLPLPTPFSPVRTATPTLTAIPSLTPSPSASSTPAPVTEDASSSSGGGIQPAGQVTCGPPPGWVRYYVQSGDRLSTLSLRLGVSVSQLVQANCLKDPNRISVGQALYVPFLPAVSLPSPLPSATRTAAATASHTPAAPFTATPGLSPSPPASATAYPTQAPSFPTSSPLPPTSPPPTAILPTTAVPPTAEPPTTVTPTAAPTATVRPTDPPAPTSAPATAAAEPTQAWPDTPAPPTTAPTAGEGWPAPAVDTPQAGSTP